MKLHKPGLHSWHLSLLHPHADPASTSDSTSGWVLKAPTFLFPHHQAGSCSHSLWPGLIWWPAAWPPCFHSYSLPPLSQRTVRATFTQHKYDLVIILSENFWSNGQNPQQSSGGLMRCGPTLLARLISSTFLFTLNALSLFMNALPSPFYPKASTHTSPSTSLFAFIWSQLQHPASGTLPTS